MSTLDILQAAYVAKCHPDTLRKMAKAGEVPATKIGRAWVFSEQLLQEWIDAKCLSTDANPAESGGSDLAARLAARRAQRIESERRSLSASSKSGSGENRSSETVVRFPGRTQRRDG